MFSTIAYFSRLKWLEAQEQRWDRKVRRQVKRAVKQKKPQSKIDAIHDGWRVDFDLLAEETQVAIFFAKWYKPIRYQVRDGGFHLGCDLLACWFLRAAAECQQDAQG